ncbi:MAG TPA: PH domain-containing protein [Fimbriimonas sp.]|nr:PH domain-containing protein [Fimbriimonas sp.]
MERLDPRSIGILFIQNIRQFIWPAAASLLPIINSSGKSNKDIPFLIIGLVLAGFGLLAFGGGLITYFRTRFGIVGADLVVKKGGLFRQDRTIPLSKIQNVTIRQGLLERLMKIATIEVETASGGGAEAKLSSVSLVEADRLREALLGSTETQATTEAEAPAVYKASLKDLAIAGALQNRSLYMIAIVLGLFGQSIDNVIEMVIERANKSGAVEYAETHPLLSVAVFSIAFLLFLIIGWLLSILYSVITFHGFKVVRSVKGLRISYGLVNTMQTLLPIRKVQSVSTNASWLCRIFGVSQISAQSIAGFKPGGEGGERIAAGSTMLAPICRPETLREVMALIFPGLQFEQVQYHQASRFWVRVMMWRTLMVLLIPAFSGIFVLWVAGKSWVWVPFVVLAILVISYPMVRLSYRNLGYAVKDGMILVRSGMISLNHWAAPITNVQSVEVTSSYFQRRRGLADVIVSTPASVSNIACVDEKAAQSLAEYIITNSYGHGRDAI